QPQQGIAVGGADVALIQGKNVTAHGCPPFRYGVDVGRGEGDGGAGPHSFDRPAEAGLSASLPRKVEPRMRVIRTTRVSRDRVPVRKVPLTKSPTRSPRISSRSATSSMPS